MALIGTSTLVFPKLDKDDGTTKRKHVCNICSRAFKRSEHCIRHRRGHTQEKPFGCRVCRRRYSRRDLLVRHERTLHTPDQLAAAIRKLQGLDDDIDAPPEVATKKIKTDHAMMLTRVTDEQIQSPNIDVAAGKTTATRTTERKPKRESPIPSFVLDPQLVTLSTIEIQPTNAAAPSISDNASGPKDLEKLRTFPSSVPLPELDGDLEFLDFFDPFLGMPPEQIQSFALPPLDTTGWSPLEVFSGSSQTSLPDYGLYQHHPPLGIESTATENDSQSLKPADRHPREHSATWEDLSSTLSATVQTHDERIFPQRSTPKQSTPSAMIYNESMRSHLLKDLSDRLTPEQMYGFRLPPAAAMQKCLRTYMDAFHIHMPIFHLQTLDLGCTPAPLVLAICAIGAQYRLERKVSALLYLKADQALAAATPDRGNLLHKKPRLLEDWVRPQALPAVPVKETLWKSQTRLLLSMLACFSGDTELISSAILRLSDFLLDFRQLAPMVRPRRMDAKALSWTDWVERESVKRLLYGEIMFGNLVTMTYGIPPGYSVASDGYIEMPCDQSLWDAQTEEQWQETVLHTGSFSPLSVKQAVSLVMDESSELGMPQECYDWSPFAISAVINVISIHIWHITQGSYLADSTLSTGSREPHKSQMLLQTEAALSSCRALITQANSDADYAWTEAETPLLFNCLAILRVSYCRAFTGHSAADSMMLLKDSQEEFDESINDFVALPQNRGDLVARAVGRAFEGMLIPYRAGTMLIKKTAALTWAIGHALAGWEIALLVTKWMHTIEVVLRSKDGASITDLEASTLQSIRNLLSELEDGLDDEDEASLAAKLLRYWAGFYDDTWVWGVTPRMANIMRELGSCYERTLAVV